MRVKICGLTSAGAMAHAAAAGAAYLGFVFYPRSPRSVDLATARDLVLGAPPGVAKVALVVDAEDAFLDALVEAVPVDMLQLHGSETPERVAGIKARWGLPVMKVVGIRDAADLPRIAEHESVADQILVDAKPPVVKPGEGRDFLPGGNALSFDWRLIAGRRWARPWMLAGGLTPENVAQAIRLTGARQVDVSSGVESSPGVKDPAKVTAFIRAAHSAGTDA